MNTAMTISEIGAWCIGWEHRPNDSPHKDLGCDWLLPGKDAYMPSAQLPDINIGEPITDAQYGNIMRLREKAIKHDHDAYVKNLKKRLGIHAKITVATALRWIACAQSTQIRDAAIDTKIVDTPPHVQEAWEEMNE